MNKEHVREWVDALRSGKYRQARGQLRDDEGKMCCLGLACELSGTGEWQELPASDLGGYVTEDTLLAYVTPSDKSWQTLPLEVQAWLGFEPGAPWPAYDNPGVQVPEMGTMRHLAVLNDEDGFTFEQIADIIEENWL